MCTEVDGQKLSDTARLQMLREIEEESKFVPSQFDRSSTSEKLEAACRSLRTRNDALTKVLREIVVEYDQTYDVDIDGMWTSAASVPVEVMERAKRLVFP
jgi:hypothetical protein